MKINAKSTSRRAMDELFSNDTHPLRQPQLNKTPQNIAKSPIKINVPSPAQKAAAARKITKKTNDKNKTAINTAAENSRIISKKTVAEKPALRAGGKKKISEAKTHTSGGEMMTERSGAPAKRVGKAMKAVLILVLLAAALTVIISAAFYFHEPDDVFIEPDITNYLPAGGAAAPPTDSNSTTGENEILASAENIAEEKTNVKYNVELTFYQKDSIKCKTAAVTVGELFRRLGVEITESERIYVGLDDMIQADSAIAIDTVEYRNITKTESVPFETEYRDVQTIKRGATKLYRNGAAGSKLISYVGEIVNGVEISRELVSEEITVYPTSAVYLRGVGGTVNIGGGTRSFSYYVDVRATRYSIQGTTATGMPTSKAVIAVDPNVIPLRSQVYISSSVGSFGVRTAADVGGGIKGNIIDIWLPAYDSSFSGWTSARVYVLD